MADSGMQELHPASSSPGHKNVGGILVAIVLV